MLIRRNCQLFCDLADPLIDFADLHANLIPALLCPNNPFLLLHHCLFCFLHLMQGFTQVIFLRNTLQFHFQIRQILQGFFDFLLVFKQPCFNLIQDLLAALDLLLTIGFAGSLANQNLRLPLAADS